MPGLVLKVPGERPTEPVGDRAPQSDDYAVALGWLLRGRSASIPADDAPAPIRASFEALRAGEILELKRGAYRASHIALYSSFAQPQPPPATGADKES
jgi:hypothetical protein